MPWLSHVFLIFLPILLLPNNKQFIWNSGTGLDRRGILADFAFSCCTAPIVPAWCMISRQQATIAPTPPPHSLRTSCLSCLTERRCVKAGLHILLAAFGKLTGWKLHPQKRRKKLIIPPYYENRLTSKHSAIISEQEDSWDCACSFSVWHHLKLAINHS